MGNWLQKNGKAIYGTKAGPYPYEYNWGSITQRTEGDITTLYLNVVDWPKEGVFKLYGLNNKVEKVSLLASGNTLSYITKFNGGAGVNVISIDVPKKAPDSYVSVIELKIEGAPKMDQTFLQQQDGTVILDAFRATVHDKEIVANKPLRPLDQRLFTVMKKGKGIMPARGMTVELNKEGEALSWDFRILKPGTYKVAVLSSVSEHDKWKSEGSMRVTVAGQSVENKLIEQERWDNERMATEMKCSVAILGKIKINTLGMQTLSLEVTSGFNSFIPNIINVQLLPIDN